MHNLDIRFGKPIWFYENGVGDMGDVDANEVVVASDLETPAYTRARFPVEQDSAILVVRIHFGGSGATLSNVSMKLDAKHGSAWDFELFRWEQVGLTEDIPGRTPVDELPAWIVPANDHIVFEYDNQHEGTLTWAICLGLVPILPDA